MKNPILSILLLVGTSGFFSACLPVDSSQEIFFPSETGQKLNRIKSFPALWRGQLVINPLRSDIQHLADPCEVIPKFARMTSWQCGGLFDENTSAVWKDWVRDLPLREMAPAQPVFQSALASRLTQASLPGVPPEMVSILRSDPLDSLRDFQERLGDWPEGSPGQVSIEFDFPPESTELTAALLRQLPGWVLVGAHGSYWENREQVSQDLGVVGGLTLVFLVLLVGALVRSGRTSLLLLVPAILGSIGLSMMATVWVFGSIHGLTLSFGSGLIGLSLDYGFHAFFSEDDRRAWRANRIGLLTTLVILATISFSEIPLLRQMMFFASVGLILSFGAIWGVRRWVSSVDLLPLQLPDRVPKGFAWGVSLAALCGWGAFFLGGSLDLSLSQFDYRSPERILVDAQGSSLKENSRPRRPVFILGEEFRGVQEWADGLGISMISPHRFLPGLSTQESNLKTWNRSLISGWVENEKFFRPFLENLESVKVLRPNPKWEVPGYLHGLTNGKEWLGILLPRTDQETALIQERVPSGLSLSEVVDEFPQKLASELQWMFPVSLLGVLFFLGLFFRRPVQVVLALIPFVCGAGLALLAERLITGTHTFVGMVGLLMIYGLSVDYGVFVADAKTISPPLKSALVLAAMTTLCGFLPLVFCRQPVLLHLGVTLVFGVMGTWVGAVTWIPRGRRWI